MQYFVSAELTELVLENLALSGCPTPLRSTLRRLMSLDRRIMTPFATKSADLATALSVEWKIKTQAVL